MALRTSVGPAMQQEDLLHTPRILDFSDRCEMALT